MAATTDQVPHAKTELRGVPVPKRQVFVGEEQTEITVPLDLIIKGTEVNLYDEILSRNLFRMFLRGRRLVLQAGGFLGLIPINENVSIEVRARVPIANLERLLLLSPEYAPEILHGHLRDFGLGSIPTPSLLDLLANRLLDAIASIRAEGLHYEYCQRKHFSSMPRGRILPFESVRSQIKTGRRLAVAFSAFERSFDTGPNRCLRLAVCRLLNIFRGMRNRKGARAMAAELGIADSYLAAAELEWSAQSLLHPCVRDPRLLPSSKSSYLSALPIAKVILQNQGLAIRSQAHDILLPSVLVNMEDVFERYFRAVLSNRLGTPDLAVLDGNLAEPAGACRPLFDDSLPGSRANRATPDVVIRKTSSGVSNELVIDAKYKPTRQPDRDDINQVLVYGLVYGCRRVGLAYPRRGASEPSVERIGRVSGIEVFRISVDLGATNLLEEEQRLVAAVRAVLEGPVRTTN